MSRRIIFFLTGTVAVLLIISLLVFFDPFVDFFDGIFKQQDEPALGSMGFKCLWQDSERYAETAPEETVRMIERYFECFCSALSDKDADSAAALTEMYVDGSADCLYDLGAISSCAARLKGSAFDLSAMSITVHLRVENVVEINKDGYIFTIEQSNETVFKNLKGISGGDGIYTHTFIFERYNGIWFITLHQCEGGVWGYSRLALNSLCGQSSPSYERLRNGLNAFRAQLDQIMANVSALITAKGYGSLPAAETPYNREHAVEYALRWTSVIKKTRNIDQWADYDSDGANFVSQCIYAGVEKMDTEGNYIWKWFGEQINYDVPEKGCSMSWSIPDNFWLYCTSHERTGLITYSDISGGQLEKGDVVQLMLGDSAFGQVIITDVVTDERGNKVDFLVTGHDNDLVNYPLSLVHCDGIRFIKVIGFTE